MLAFGAAAFVYGCSISPAAGELPSECSDSLDNDNDGAGDCEDTDCQALSVCGLRAPIRDASVPPGQIGDAFVGTTDAGSEPPIDEPPVLEPPVDSSIPEPEPDPEPVETGCPGGCGPDQHCVANACFDREVAVADVWMISRIDVKVPRSIDTGSSPECLDAACVGFYLRRTPYLSCECPPDPKVEVWVDLDPGDDLDAELAGETSVAEKRDQTRWTQPLEIKLLAVSVVHMKVLDMDGDEFEHIFGCAMPEASVQIATSGVLECKQMFPEPGASGAEEFAITAQFAPTQVE
jgi:hypothetical protein